MAPIRLITTIRGEGPRVVGETIACDCCAFDVFIDCFKTKVVNMPKGMAVTEVRMPRNSFINAVYISHPGWKAMGGRIGYSALPASLVILLCWFGTISRAPRAGSDVAILTDSVIYAHAHGSQAFQETPKASRTAIILSRSHI